MTEGRQSFDRIMDQELNRSLWSWIREIRDITDAINTIRLIGKVQKQPTPTVKTGDHIASVQGLTGISQ